MACTGTGRMIAGMIPQTPTCYRFVLGFLQWFCFLAELSPNLLFKGGIYLWASAPPSQVFDKDAPASGEMKQVIMLTNTSAPHPGISFWCLLLPSMPTYVDFLSQHNPASIALHQAVVLIKEPLLRQRTAPTLTPPKRIKGGDHNTMNMRCTDSC